MSKSLVITFDEKDENLLMAFFNRLKIKALSVENGKEVRIQKRIQEAVQTGYWQTLNEDEQEEFVFGCMLEEVDTSKTVDTGDFLRKLKSNLVK